MSSLLQVTDLRAGYGSMPVLHGLSLEVSEGELTVLLGTNGAGKTTSLHAIAGLLRPWSGTVAFERSPVDRRRPEQLVALGIATVPAPPGIFRDLTVDENLRVGAFALGRDRGKADEQLARALDTFPVLAERRGQHAGSLSGGEQRMLAIARALMSAPRLLLVDEASMGLSPAMVRATFALLEHVRADGVTILMAEQNVAALDVADHAFVLERGRVVHDARDEAITLLREQLSQAYLGTAPPELVGSGR